MPSLVQTLTKITVNYNKLRTITTNYGQLQQITDNYNKITDNYKKRTDNYKLYGRAATVMWFDQENEKNKL